MAPRKSKLQPDASETLELPNKNKTKAQSAQEKTTKTTVLKQDPKDWYLALALPVNRQMLYDSTFIAGVENHDNDILHYTGSLCTENKDRDETLEDQKPLTLQIALKQLREGTEFSNVRSIHEAGMIATSLNDFWCSTKTSCKFINSP